MSSKISALAVLTSAQPDDVIPVVDVHDTTMALTGTDKQISVASLLAGALPTLAQASVSASATLALNTITTVTAATALTMTLPTATTGALIVERASASTANVAVTGNIRGVAGTTITLSLSSESEMFFGYGGSWWPIAGHKTLSSLQAIFAPALSLVQAQQYKTTADQVSLAAHVQPAPFAAVGGVTLEGVVVDPFIRGQQFLGVGAALTDAAAYVLLNYLTASQRLALLTELYGPTSGWSTVRIAFGWHTYSSQGTQYSYDDTTGSARTVGTTASSNVVTDTSAVAADAGKALNCPGFGGKPSFVGAVTPGTGYTVVTAPGGSTACNAVATQASVAAVLYPCDPGLANFSLGLDTENVVPVLQQILAINPRVKVLASVWSPPNWMRCQGSMGGDVSYGQTTYTDMNMYWCTNQAVTGGTSSYGNYIVQAILAYRALGIPIYSVCPQNEWIGANCNYTDTDYGTMVQAVGQAIDNAGLDTVLWGHDHHWFFISHVTPISAYVTDANAMLGVPAVAQWLKGIAWHAYTEESAGASGLPWTPVGQPGTSIAQEQAWRYNRDVEHHMTEIRTFPTQTWSQAMALLVGACVVGNFRHHGSSFTMWNLCLDQNGAPSQGVSPARNGVVAISNTGSGAVTRNADYYALRAVGSVVQPGAYRCASTSYTYGAAGTDLQSVAFVNPDNSVALILFNNSASPVTTTVIDARTGTGFPVTVAAGEVSSFLWGTAVQSSPAGSPATVTAAGAPSLTATGGAGQVTLTITPGTAGTYPVTAWQVSRATSPGAETPLAVIPASQVTYTDLLGAAGTWYYTVTPYSGGGGTASTEHSATATSATAPSAPAVTASTPAASTVQLSWPAVTPNGAAVQYYTVERSTTSGAEAAIVVLPAGTLSYTDTAVSIGTVYYYKVQAVNSAGTATSAEVNATPLGITFGAAVTANTGGNASSLTWSHTVTTGTHPVLIVILGGSPGGSGSIDGISGVTYGGVALTRCTTAVVPETGSPLRESTIWYLVNPPAGTANVVATSPISTSPITSISVQANFVSQATPFGTPATPAYSTSATGESVTTAGGSATDIVLGAYCCRNAATPTNGSGQATIAASVFSTVNLTLTQQAGGTGTITTAFTQSPANADALCAAALRQG
jgi:O-glycosyl hydrolase